MRFRHYLWAIFGGLFLTIFIVIIYASCQEWRRTKQGEDWRWTDWAYLVACGAVGQAVQLFIIFLNLGY